MSIHLIPNRTAQTNTPRQIRERREKILLLMARGYNQSEIVDELGTTRVTIHKDMKYINEMTNRGLFELARKSFSTMYVNCNDGYNEILKECWKIYVNAENNPEARMV